MLVITRKPCQSFIIEGVGRIIILSVDEDRVKVGVDIPKEINVYRSELEPKEKP